MELKFPMSVPAGFSKAQLDEWFGENAVGAQTLYEPEQYWLGTALSGFGVVYNRDVLKELGIQDPETFIDLTDPKYAGMLALADPRIERIGDDDVRVDPQQRRMGPRVEDAAGVVGERKVLREFVDEAADGCGFGGRRGGIEH